MPQTLALIHSKVARISALEVRSPLSRATYFFWTQQFCAEPEMIEEIKST